mgnify:CR=1 FL=1
MFKVKTTSQESYYVRPNLGIITARSARSVTFIFRKPLGGEVSKYHQLSNLAFQDERKAARDKFQVQLAVCDMDQIERRLKQEADSSIIDPKHLV